MLERPCTPKRKTSVLMRRIKMLAGIAALATPLVLTAGPAGATTAPSSGPLSGTCYYLVNYAGQYVTLGAHNTEMEWTVYDGSCMGFKDLGTVGGYAAFQIGGGGICLDEADDNVYNESCVTPVTTNETWLLEGNADVYQNEASYRNLTADQANGYLVTAGGPGTDYNEWAYTTTPPP